VNIKTIDIKLHCPECNCNKEKKDFYWSKIGQKVYVECKSCMCEILKERRKERKEERLFYGNYF
jgi:hypothetical protein